MDSQIPPDVQAAYAAYQSAQAREQEAHAAYQAALAQREQAYATYQRALEASPPPVAPASPVEATAALPATPTSPAASNEKVRVRHKRKHRRPWWKRVLQSFFPNQRNRGRMVALVVLVLILSVVLAAALTVRQNQGGSPSPEALWHGQHSQGTTPALLPMQFEWQLNCPPNGAPPATGTIEML